MPVSSLRVHDVRSQGQTGGRILGPEVDFDPSARSPLILIFLFGGGGFYAGPPYHYFGGGLSLLLVIVLLVMLFRR